VVFRSYSFSIPLAAFYAFGLRKVILSKKEQKSDERKKIKKLEKKACMETNASM